MPTLMNGASAILHTRGNADISDKVLGPIADYLEEGPDAANADGP